MTFSYRNALVAAVAILLIAPQAGAATLPRATLFAAPSISAPGDDAAGEAYCKSTGGTVEHRIPVYGTNNPSSSQLVLSGSAEFCQYTKKSDGSRIHVLISTLTATKPTLAALAYYAKLPLSNASCPGGANPASCYCTYLGGSDQFGGANLAGGAWVGKGVDVDLEACIFPDMSSIDSWGLAYHSNNIIRGIDLAKVLMYHHKS
jgi:hypothetical protein